MGSTIGARLRQHREEQGIALSTVAEQTKIKASLLEGLERDDLARWPPGIYRRAYVRAYANAISLSPDTVVREFLEAYPEPAEILEPAMPAAVATAGRANGGPPTRIRHLVGSAMGSLSRLRRADVLVPSTSARPAERPTEAPTVPEAALMFEPAAPEPARIAVSPKSVSIKDPIDEQPIQLAPEPSPGLDLLAAADLCTALGRVEHASQVQPLLREAARILDARGLIVWVWDALASELKPALAHGYPDKVLAQLSGLRRDADNVTAAAFRSARTLSIHGTAHSCGALAVPLLTQAACAGVLAIELPDGREEAGPVRAVSTFFAAMLAQLVGGPPPDSSP